MELGYLFECHFSDGTMLQQTAEDVSQIASSEEHKSAFYDVMQRIDDVIVFGIVDPNHTYSVDLRDGHFEIDGLAFTIHDKEDLPPDAKYRLVYFRRRTEAVTLGYVQAQTSSVAYHIGWQTTVDGKNYQKTIAVR
jgi:hypothetical protein